MSVERGAVHSYRLVRWGISGLAVALVLVLMGAVGAERVQADGGLPATSTFTPSPTVTLTPTQAFLLVPTNTSVPQLLLLATNTPVSESGLPAYPMVTPRPSLGLITEPTVGPTQEGQPLICLALPVALIIIAIIVFSSLSYWRKYNPA